MGVGRFVGKTVGVIGGGVIGGSVKVIGKVAGTKFPKTGEYVDEIGRGIYHASKFAGDNAGQFVDGTVKTGYGYATKNDTHTQNGWGDLKDSTGRTWNGVTSTVKFTGANLGTTYRGAVSGNRDQVVDGLKNIGRVVAVAGLAVGIIDFVDGDVVVADTDNNHLADRTHPVTGVEFHEDTVELQNGTEVRGVFPEFQTDYQMKIGEEHYLASDYTHFNMANEALLNDLEQNPSMIHDFSFTDQNLTQLSLGETPDGYTWHHHQEPGVLQLVDVQTHEDTGHTGGRHIWGGGTEYR